MSAFELRKSADSLVNGVDDVFFEDPTIRFRFTFQHQDSPIALPRVVLRAHAPMRGRTDAPFTISAWPIFSNALIRALESVGSFPHSVHAVEIADMDGTLWPATDQQFSVLHVQTTLTEAFDRSASVYGTYDAPPELVGEVSWVTSPSLIEPPGRFPVAFKIPELPFLLLSEAAAEAVRGFRGIQLTEIPSRPATGPMA